MPAAVALVATAAGYAAATAVGLTLAATPFMFAIVAGATSMVASKVLNHALGYDKLPNSASAADAGQVVNTASTVDPIPVVYGKRKIGGTRVFIDTNGSENKELHVVIAHCEGEIQWIPETYFNDVLSTDPKFAGKFTIEHGIGADNQVANATLNATFPTKWTTNHKLSGVAYTYVKFIYDQQVWSGLPTIGVVIEGRKVKDVRDNSYGWSENPALCLYDYLTNSRFGRGIAEADIDVESFKTAASYCDEVITFTVTGVGTQNKKRYTCNGIIDTNNNSIDNVQQLLTCMRGMLIFSAGKYKLVLDRASVAGFNFNESNITGGWTISLENKRLLYNRIRATWVNPDKEWQPDIAVADSPSYRTADRGLMLEDELNLSFTTNVYEAQMLAQRRLKQSRFGITVSFRSTIAGMICECGDVVSITHPTPGWTNKLFRVMHMTMLNSDEVEITAMEYDDSVYAIDPLNAPRVSLRTELPDPQSLSAPAGFTLVNGIAQNTKGDVYLSIIASWTVPTNGVAVSAELQVRDHVVGMGDEEGWITWARPLPKDGKAIYSNSIIDGKTYDFRIRYGNAFGVKSAWTASTITAETLMSIGLPTPQNAKIYCSPDAQGQVSRMKLTCSFNQDDNPFITAQYLTLMLAIHEYPPKLDISLDEGNRLKISDFDPIAVNAAMYTTLAGSTTTRLIVKTVADPLPLGYNLAGMWWCKVGTSEWRKVSSYDATGINFDVPFDITPTAGMTVAVAEIPFFDERPSEFRFAVISNGSAHEVIKWTSLEQIGDDFYVDGLTRALEGTTQISAANGTVSYYPAPGPGTQMFNIENAAFRSVGGGNFEASIDVHVTIPPNYWAAGTAVIWLPTTTGIIRSTIVPVTYGGML